MSIIGGSLEMASDIGARPLFGELLYIVLIDLSLPSSSTIKTCVLFL